MRSIILSLKGNIKKVIFSIVILYLLLLQFGVYYWGKPDIGYYNNRSILPFEYIAYEEEDLVILPDKYRFYGRYAHIGETYEDGETPKLSFVQDRKVGRWEFEYDNQRYYFYYSSWQTMNHSRHEYRCSPFEITYPDVYNADTDEMAFSFRENPEGYFISDNCIYYAYGSHKYCLSALQLHNYVFSYVNRKDYRFARLNMDTFLSEKITKKQYEEAYAAFSYED